MTIGDATTISLLIQSGPQLKRGPGFLTIRFSFCHIKSGYRLIGLCLKLNVAEMTYLELAINILKSGKFPGKLISVAWISPCYLNVPLKFSWNEMKLGWGGGGGQRFDDLNIGMFLNCAQWPQAELNLTWMNECTIISSIFSEDFK